MERKLIYFFCKEKTEALSGLIFLLRKDDTKSNEKDEKITPKLELVAVWQKLDW